jgi:hypothetical protein
MKKKEKRGKLEKKIKNTKKKWKKRKECNVDYCCNL